MKYNRPCSLTIEDVRACGVTAVSESHTRRSLFLSEILVHVRGLFATRKMILSTLLLWLSWALIGIAYPRFQVFLPTYLASRGAEFGQLSTDVTWRNYAIANVCSIFGPVAGGLLAKTILGRRYTMVVGALLTSKSGLTAKSFSDILTLQCHSSGHTAGSLTTPPTLPSPALSTSRCKSGAELHRHTVTDLMRLGTSTTEHCSPIRPKCCPLPTGQRATVSPLASIAACNWSRRSSDP